MTPPSPALTPGGTVAAAGRDFCVAKLSLAQEQVLGNALAAAAKREYGPGGYFAKMAPVLDWLKKSDRGTEFAQAVRRLTEMEATGQAPAGDAVEEYRQSAKGVALELYFRTRQAHPDVTAADLAAVVTEANAVEVYLQLIDAITDGRKSP